MIRAVFSLQLVSQQCCAVSWKVLLHVLPPMLYITAICCTKENSPSVVFAQHVTATYIINTAGNARDNTCQLTTQYYCERSCKKNSGCNLCLDSFRFTILNFLSNVWFCYLMRVSHFFILNWVIFASNEFRIQFC